MDSSGSFGCSRCFSSGGIISDNVDSNAKSKDKPVVEVDGLEGVDTLGASIRHPGQPT